MSSDPRSVTLDNANLATVTRRLRSYQSWMFREIARYKVRWHSVVDLGCGNGDWTVQLAARSCHQWYLDALRTAGFEVLSAKTATEFVADDIGSRWFGGAGWMIAWPLRLIRRAYRAFLRTNVLACVARPATGAIETNARRDPDAVILAFSPYIIDTLPFL